MGSSVASTGTGTGDRNVDGQVIAITVFSTLRWWARWFLPVLFVLVRRVPRITATLRALSFIHFARWSVVRALPDNGPGHRGGPLRHGHMYFESNFNGGWEEYIDAFSHILTRGMWAFWGSSYGFPRALPTVPFKAYIRANEYEASHYHAAYPTATTTMVRDALALEADLAPLVERAEGMDPDDFADAWRELLVTNQRRM